MPCAGQRGVECGGIAHRSLEALDEFVDRATIGREHRLASRFTPVPREAPDPRAD